MGRIIFLSAMALLAYKYIARSNQRHQPLDSGASRELPPPPTSREPVVAPEIAATAVEPDPQPSLVAAGSRAAEPDPRG